ncbi:uncharacterized protein YutE (UPF0331/DUF86 family) [Scopulibacillus darangshiensis]|uniref:Uncharacterized protein YutE (UPF0331/DUF86 family) n=1 Tax=Scopulibacillus darangshiensis TaxID=442528 RepID=A0A4R2ND83_9BACL|nr:DUF86 domain-containing protein [Scopulibacillus darangshiensis]TCP19137.1 uncharacterized protein YutE (UPF0331/DUF86 family) [Scopulibacillus darangshiensis]
MYFIDREKIERMLAYMTETLGLLKETHTWTTPLEKLALERVAQNVIEAVIDVGNQMIDGFIMRDPGSYEDIIDILVDEQVVPREHEDGLKQVIRLRKSLVQDYVTLNHEAVYQVVKENIDKLVSFPKHVNDYLEKELGPVSAFMPKKQQ